MSGGITVAQRFRFVQILQHCHGLPADQRGERTLIVISNL